MSWNGAKGTRASRAARVGLERLEDRLALNSTSLLPEQGQLLPQIGLHGAACGCAACGGLPMVPAQTGAQAGATSGSGTAGAAAVGAAASVPAYSSLPTANATLYLDFDGHSESSWGSYGSISAPAYDTDGDATTFSTTELA